MLNVDPTLLRLIVVATAIFSGGAPVIFLYIIAAIVIPKEPQFPGMFPPHGNPFAQGPSQPPMYGSQPPMQPPVNSYGYSSTAASQQYPQQPPASPQMNKSNHELDEMMKDIEQKAMRKELDELRAKLAKYEKGE